MQNTSPAIRSARKEDHARLAELCCQLGYASTAPQIAERIAGFQGSPDHAVFVAEMNQEVVGWISVFVFRCLEMEDRGEISGLVVDEHARSQGIGLRLLARAEDWARERGCSAMGVRSNVVRGRAHVFYERHGYKHVKTQKSFRKDL